MKIILITGTRPNIIKAFSLYHLLKKNFNVIFIHTGQHYDYNMSEIFFNELSFKPDIILELNNNTKAGELDNYLYNNKDIFSENIKNILSKILFSNLKNCGQLGEIIIKLNEKILLLDPDLIIVFGDVTSTLAASILGYKLNIKIAHVEAGLRSFDYNMPEEINRNLVDKIAYYKFCTEESAIDNLKNEKNDKNTYLVGNTMFDTLKFHYKLCLKKKTYLQFDCNKNNYIIITLHRPQNVDNIQLLCKIINDVLEIAVDNNCTIIFPIHPRTKKLIEKTNIYNKCTYGQEPSVLANHVNFCEPLGYLDFICLLKNAKYIITDSGGIQEESMALNKRCFTIRDNTERPSTLINNGGTNLLIKSINEIKSYIDIELIENNILNNTNAGEKINNILITNLNIPVTVCPQNI